MRNRKIKRVLLFFLAGLFLMGMPVFADQGTININTASEKQLCGLKRVGKKYAARIVRYRKEVGPFKTPEEIMRVPGIGLKTFQANKDLIIVGEAITAAEKKE